MISISHERVREHNSDFIDHSFFEAKRRQAIVMLDVDHHDDVRRCSTKKKREKKEKRLKMISRVDTLTFSDFLQFNQNILFLFCQPRDSDKKSIWIYQFDT